MNRQFLVCDDAVHAEFVDGLVLSRLADEQGSKASRWSGVYTDGTRYGILWASPVSDLFGDLSEDGLVVEETEDKQWQEVVPELPESLE